MSRENRFLWIAFQLLVRMALWATVAKGLLLHAQSHERRVSDRRQCRTRAESRDGNDFGIAAEGLDFDVQAIQKSPVPNPVDSATLALPVVKYEEVHGGTIACGDCFSAADHLPEGVAHPQPPPVEDEPGEGPRPLSVGSTRDSNQDDLNRDIYYRNKLEFSLDGGWLPINIPFVFDVFLGDAYNTTSLKYTLAPIIASLRWQMDEVGGPWIFRGNWDLTASAAATMIPRGPETRYLAWIMGVRRNFVPRRGRIAPYFDGRVGLGNIDAKGPFGVLYAQGQNFTFTVNMGSGVRYNFNSRYSISAGLNWMHISNLYLSQPKFADYGINVYGPIFGFNVRIGKPHHHASE